MISYFRLYKLKTEIYSRMFAMYLLLILWESSCDYIRSWIFVFDQEFKI